MKPAVLTFAAALAAFALAAASPTAGGPLPAASPAPTQPVATPAPVAAPAHELTATDVGAWLDGLMPTALNTAQTPGAVVVVVKDGQVLFEKGYGYADYEKRTPVNIKTTLFRPGSTSKLFTWTAVMQLVEQGKIDLDADVNQYLDFNIPKLNGQPVTMRMLMTHRAGFSETAKDLLTYGKAPPPLGKVLSRYVPPRLYGPDGGPGYSNYGASLAGYIVERVSGQPFETYVDQHIFAPLGMKNASFAQPLPANLAGQMSKGYETWDKPGPGFEVISMPPAGALSASGDDMSHFMIAQLSQGQYGGAQILKPATVQQMQTSITKAFPDLDGNALGFYRQDINGHRAVAHAGDTNYFHSDLILFPDDHLGLFISVNAKGKEGMGEFLRGSVFEQFADRYLPAAAPPSGRVDAATAKAHAAMIAGLYMNTRRSDSTFIDIIRLLAPTMVTANADGTISAEPVGQPERFYEASPFLWQQVNGHDRLQATVENGRVTRWSTDSAAPIFVFVRPGGLLGAGLEAPLAEAALGILALTLILWPITAAVRFRYGAPFVLTGQRAWAYRLLRIAAGLGLLAIVMWYEVLMEVSSTTGAPVDLLLHLSQLASFIAFVGGLIVALWNLALVFARPSGWFAKVCAVVWVLAFGFMLWIALSYHLIGVSGQY
jgi:CubicO group peptidase (beta-lactamase class C family)